MFWNRSEPPARRPAPPIPTADDDATEVHSGWQNILHRHTGPTPFSPPPPDGFRHSPPPFSVNPQGANPYNSANPYGPPAAQEFSRSTTPPPIPQIQRQYADSTDIGAQLHLNQVSTPQHAQRVLEYYGDPKIKNILTVVGQQVHSASPYGVEITANGPTLQRQIIPWHRVHALLASPDDPILRNNS